MKMKIRGIRKEDMKSITFADYSDYKDGKGSDGGCYVQYYIYKDMGNGKYLNIDSSSSYLIDDVEEIITEKEFIKKFINLYKYKVNKPYINIFGSLEIEMNFN